MTVTAANDIDGTKEVRIRCSKIIQNYYIGNRHIANERIQKVQRMKNSNKPQLYGAMSLPLA